MNILVFDLGTTNFKASVFDGTGALRALTRLPTPITPDVPDRCEISPAAFQETIVKLIQQLNEALPNISHCVDAITFATQTNSFILLAENDAPLTPIILWPDNRALESGDGAVVEHELPDLYETTGVPALSHQFMVSKIAWLKRNQAGALNNTSRLCLISDYLSLWFTGQHVTEAGTAGLTGLIDIHKRDWWPKGCTAHDIPLEWLPHVVQAGTNLGTIIGEVAKVLGLNECCRFIVGCLDQYAGAMGVGNIIPGGISETTGTVLATVKCTDALDLNDTPELFQGPAFAPGLYYQMVFASTAGNCLEAYRNTLQAKVSFADLDAEAQYIPAGGQGTSRAHNVREILESVSYALSDQVSILCDDTLPPRIVCAGGAAQSTLWLQIKAHVLNCPMQSVQCPEPTSMGAAILAMHTLSGDAVSHVVSNWIKFNQEVVPDEAQHEIYAKIHPKT